ncbi:hypothetical protein [Faecalicatena contorta]|uniref:Uncharacterized protein n=1 Tax=Faecalicatena contorta TaxID=39482 RepID=A0A315ZS10_9FIRM|nr:hypothetical protein [Faecalicatena contorta]PWJ48082.1 hypothetical protein A8805_11458 [Faecalicatena contorta]SUQ15609.1 hypothetical protein SAMN05216529_11458 [Faecalicatena contorta]
MLNDKENEKIIDDYDYLSNAASSMDCTGLIPSLPVTDAELESYNDLYQYQPPVIREKTSKHANSSEEFSSK